MTNSIYRYNYSNWAFLIFMLICSCSNIIIAQYGPIRFDKLTTREGLSHNIVNCIFQDSKGYIWFGTEAGVSRYDGYEMVNFLPDTRDTNSLISPGVKCIIEDKRGFLWFATEYGISRFDRVYNKFTNIKIQGTFAPISNISSIIQDKDENIWAGTGNGIVCVNYHTCKTTMFLERKVENNRESFWAVYSLLYDKQTNNIWVGARNSRLYCLNSKGEVLKTYRLKNKDPRYVDLQFNSIYSLTQDLNHNIWIGCIDGIVKLDVQTNILSYFEPGGINAIAGKNTKSIICDNLGNIWAATDNGLSKYDPIYSKFTNFTNSPFDANSISSNVLHSVYIDRNNILWVGTMQEGVCKMNLMLKKFENWQYIPNVSKITQKNIYSLLVSESGYLWSGSHQGVLEKINRYTGEVESKGIFSTDIGVSSNVCAGAMEIDRKGRLWIGSWSLWLVMYDPKTGNIQNFRRLEDKPNSLGAYSLRDLCLDSLGNLWIASIDDGLDMLDLSCSDNINPQNAIFKHYKHKVDDIQSLPSNSLQSLSFDHKGNLWIGTFNDGLIKMDTLHKTFVSYVNKPFDNNSLINNHVNYTHVTADNKLWIATYKGLDFFDPEKQKFKHYTTENGLCKNIVMGILEDKNSNLWLSTEQGLSKFDTRNETFENYNYNDGLAFDEFNQRACFYDKESSLMYFGGVNGITVFNPDSIKPGINNSNVVITNLKIHGVSIVPGQEVNGDVILQKNIDRTQTIILNHKNNYISFEFAALHFAAPFENKYRYKLEGFDNDWKWSASNKREANYTNLPAGNYIFKVTATDNDGNWCNQTASIVIVIEPPVWETWWFRILILIIVIEAIILYIRYRTKRLEKQKKILENKVHERTKELEESNTLLEEKQEEINLQKEMLENQNVNLEIINSSLTLHQAEIEKQNSELNEHRNHLRTMVEERTKELEEAKQRAEESDRLKSAFLANMSHEIRTPMNAIVGFSNLLNDCEITEEQKNDFRLLIMKNSESLLVLIDDILDLSKIQAQQLFINKKNINLNALLDEILYFYNIKCADKGIEFIISIPVTGEFIIQTDPVRLKQVITNLLNNALKFTEKGSISVGYNLETDGYLHFYVKDSGYGIPESIGNSIFERFMKVEQDNAQLHGGAGLGLPISKSLIELMGGKIWYQSVRGQGTTFNFIIPLINITSTNKKDTDKMIKDIDLSNHKVLVAEDEEANYMVLSALLSKFKPTLTWVKNGQEAVKKVSEQEFDLVFMDIKMPIMNGVEALAEIKKTYPKLPVIAQTAFARPEEIEDYLNMGFDGYLTKPIRVNDLVSTVRQFM